MNLFCVIPLFLLVSSIQSQDYATLESSFEEGIEPWTQDTRNSAQWVWTTQGDGGAAPSPIEGTSYLSIQVVSESAGRGVLMSPQLSIPQGGIISIDFWIRSKSIQGDTLDVSLIAGNEQTHVLSLTEYATPFNSMWRRATAMLPASEGPVQIVIDSFFTRVSGNGIAIDNIKVLVKSEPTTTSIPLTTEQPPETTTEGLPDTTTELVPETTTEPLPETTTEPLPETTTESLPETTTEPLPETTTEPLPETTTEPLPETTTEPLPETTTEPLPETTTESLPETTTEALPETTTEPLPETTTESLPETTTEPLPETTTEPLPETTTEGLPATTSQAPATTPSPSGPLIYDFSTGLQGWTLGRQNGARWKRVEVSEETGPSKGLNSGALIEVNWIDLYSGGVVAESPFLVVEGDQLPTIEVTFWVKGSMQRPAQLQLKRKINSTYDEAPFLNLDSYGMTTSPKWITVSRTVPAIDSSPFKISLYGFLGLDFNNEIAVKQIVISGVRPLDVVQRLDFNFENGLEGWLTSNLDGGIWVQRNYSAISGSVPVPRPPFGEGVFFATSYVTHSGLITIESPPIEAPAGTVLKASISFWIGDVSSQPGWVLVRKKTSSGQYDVTPFIDSSPLGSSLSNRWVTLERTIPIEEERTFQLVIEAYLGGRSGNLIAVDRLQISEV